MISTELDRRAGVLRRVSTSLCALLAALAIAAGPARADDISGELADDTIDVYTDDVPDEPVGESLDVYTDDEPEESDDEYADEDAEEVDEGPGFGRIAWDVALLRPMNFVRLTAGCVLMVPVAVLTISGGTDNVRYMADYFIDQPYWDTFGRPLGKF